MPLPSTVQAESGRTHGAYLSILSFFKTNAGRFAGTTYFFFLVICFKFRLYNQFYQRLCWRTRLIDKMKAIQRGPIRIQSKWIAASTLSTPLANKCQQMPINMHIDERRNLPRRSNKAMPVMGTLFRPKPTRYCRHTQPNAL